MNDKNSPGPGYRWIRGPDDMKIGSPLRREAIRGDDEIMVFDSYLLVRRKEKQRKEKLK